MDNRKKRLRDFLENDESGIKLEESAILDLQSSLDLSMTPSANSKNWKPTTTENTKNSKKQERGVFRALFSCWTKKIPCIFYPKIVSIAYLGQVKRTVKEIPTNALIIGMKAVTMFMVSIFIFSIKDTEFIRDYYLVNQSACVSDNILKYFEEANNLLNDPSRNKLRTSLLASVDFVKYVAFLILLYLW